MGTIFFPSRSPKYSKIIRIDTVKNAKESIARLKHEFNSADSMKKMLKLNKYALVARTRARIIAKNKRVSLSQRKEAAAVARLYNGYLKVYLAEYMRLKKRI